MYLRKRLKIKGLIKSAWVMAVCVFLLTFLYKKWPMVLEAANQMPLHLILESSLAILVAKLCLVTHMQLSANKFQIKLSWLQSYWIYNYTQLAKYIPGSIWQFIGRYALLQSQCNSPKIITKSIFLEHLWVIIVALIFASTLVFSDEIVLPNWALGQSLTSGYIPIIISLLLIIITGVFYTKYGLAAINILAQLKPSAYSIIVVSAAWILFGISIWVTLSPYVDVDSTLLYIIGIYALAYVVGFLTPFSPAGLGVRELILVFALVPLGMSNDIAIMLATINRIIYLLVEIILVLTFIVIKKHS